MQESQIQAQENNGVQVKNLPVYLTEKEVADRFRMSVMTLRKWRWQGIGPNWRKFGKSVRYFDVDEWERSRFASNSGDSIPAV